MGKPHQENQRANIRTQLGVVTAIDPHGSAQRPHVFVEGDDYNLWCLYWDGTAESNTSTNWTWTPFTGTLTLMDTNSAGFPRRFYRATAFD